MLTKFTSPAIKLLHPGKTERFAELKKTLSNVE